MKYILTAVIAMTLFISCSGNDNLQEQKTDYTKENDKEIVDYLAKNKLTAQKTASGLYYIINEAGTGAQPTSNSRVTVTYKGYYTSGTVFDKRTEPISFNLSEVITGWKEGIPFFKEGGSGVLLVPSHLGYGSYTQRGIPGGSVLVFDISLISVDK
ncbi:FKBP-type peptidyl-prolyl cis-trans isomerase [Flavobacterium branchiicola]|uniref:Peptidyl-prolyl cis-trans isomerase n=1 Tax=Flavobacterium branchiicola TaxID=1114875 RepID=A0ABV9PEP9_9FLAO|nr:FKBP-type peptidyl-prolyl cis-trans isomerase [Flavobacterium branchiicola]MBS7254384.1 FKBP-type peptidyl-prolyl cis-trans isomerase [Flavobacterium branchiicola]